MDGNAFKCKTGLGVVSLFFNVTSDCVDCKDTNGFFEWINHAEESAGNKTIDLSKLLPQDAAMYTNVTGYIGSLTAPPCSKDVCWYIVEEVFKIEESELNYFQYADVERNARAANLSPVTKYGKIMRNVALFNE